MNKPVVVISEPQYKKGLKRLYATHNQKAIDTLEEIVTMLSTKQQLPTRYKPHKLKGVDQWECHIQPDVLLTWRYEEDKLVINLRLLNLTNHDQLDRKSKIHGGSCMKRILGRHRVVTNKRYHVKAGQTGEYVMTPEEEADWDRRWEERFGFMDGKAFTPDEFNKLMEEMINFE